MAENRILVLNLMMWTRNTARGLIDSERGELSILEDVVQEGLMAGLESQFDNEKDLRHKIQRTMENYLSKHRERGYKKKMWQNSVDHEFSEFCWGDNPDYE